MLEYDCLPWNWYKYYYWAAVLLKKTYKYYFAYPITSLWGRYYHSQFVMWALKLELLNSLVIPSCSRAQTQFPSTPKAWAYNDYGLWFVRHCQASTSLSFSAKCADSFCCGRKITILWLLSEIEVLLSDFHNWATPEWPRKQI